MPDYTMEIIWSDDRFADSTSYVSRLCEELARHEPIALSADHRLCFKLLERISAPEEVIPALEKWWGSRGRDARGFRVWIADLDYYDEVATGREATGIQHLREFAERDIQTNGVMVLSTYAGNFREKLLALGIKWLVDKHGEIEGIGFKPQLDELLHRLCEFVCRRTTSSRDCCTL